MTKHEPHHEIGIRKVIDGGYCIGCGVCTAIVDSPIRITLTDTGKYQATFDQSQAHWAAETSVMNVCPFSGMGANETEIGASLYADSCAYDERLGYWSRCYIGHVAEADFRARGSSGGIVTWLACHLLDAGEIDAVLHVVPSNEQDKSTLFSYGISTTTEAIRAGAKSRYYAVEMSEALAHVRLHPARYLVVGVPCFIKAARLLCREDEVFSDRLRYTVSILCGHLKSVDYQVYLSWQLGIGRNETVSFDFRHKMPNKPASSYAIQVVRRRAGEDETITSLMNDLRGKDWGLGLFKYAACDYCDDVMGETADISCGDAWIEPFSSDSLGTSVAVVRSSLLADRIEAARETGALALSPTTPDTVAKTQEASFRHRRDGLAYRLWLKQRSDHWAPPKRVVPGWRHLSRKYRKIFRIRQEMVAVSDAALRESKQADSFSTYWPRVASLAQRYHRCYHPLWIAIPRRMWRIIAGFALRKSTS